ncbi:MAG: tetratricopeptide repeat protein [Bacteroidales bacterium]|nr:tetratricopeptide repeat protein [Bacteroidales bacterium]
MSKKQLKKKSPENKTTATYSNNKKSSFFKKDQNRNAYIFGALLLTFIVYFQSLFNDFTLNWDDGGYVVINDVIQKLSWENIKIMFSSFDKGNYHPLTTLFYALEYALVRDNPLLYHINNLILHLVNVYLVFILMMKINKNTLTAFIVAVFFGIHPMHVESVAWVSERKDVMYTMFFLLSVLAYHRFVFIKNSSKKYYFFSLLYFFLALMSKSAAVVLPVVLVLIDLFLNRRYSTQFITEKIPFFLLSFLFGILAIMSQDSAGAIQDLDPLFSIPERLMLASYAMIAYIVKLFVPVNLCAMYPYPDRIGGSLPLLFKLAPFAAIIIFGLVAWSTKFTKYIVFGFLFFLVTIALVLQLLPVGGALMAERYTYIPYIGLFFIIAYSVEFIKKKHEGIYPFIMALLILGMGVFSYLTYERTKVWKNGEILFTDVINKNPYLPFAYNNRGYLYYRFHENYEKAYADFSKCIEIDPTFDKAYSNRGVLLYNQNKFEEALSDFNVALNYKPDNIDALRGRANTYSSMKQFAMAIPDYNAYLSVKPDEESIILWRGTAFYQTQQYEKALIDFNKTLSVNPSNDEAYYWRGLVYYNTKEYNTAIQDFSTSIRLNDKRDEVYSWRGLAYYYLKNYDMALNDYNKALELNPQDAAAFVNRSIVYHDMGNYPQAFEDIKKAGELGYPLDRNYFFKLYNLVEGK